MQKKKKKVTMLKNINSLNIKLQFLLLSFISLYFVSYFFIISPKIKSYLVENKKMYYEMELKKISAIINSHAQYIREYEKSIKIFNPEVIRLRVQEKIAEESEKITAIIKELRIEKNGYILLVNEKTRKYIHPNPKFHNKSIDIYEKRNNIDLIKALKESYEQNKSLQYKWNKNNGQELFEKIAWVDYNSYFNWYIISAAFKDDLEKDFVQLNSNITIVSIFAFLIIYLFALSFVKNIIFPLNNLMLNIKIFKSGNYDEKAYINISSNDEFETINNDFNDMKSTIINNINYLENQVLLRTKQLEKKLYYDELTGLENNIALLERIKEEEFSSIVIININKFRDINELYGYRIGNILIEQLATNFKRIAQKYNLELYRIEGISFAFLKTGPVVFDKFCKKIVNYQKRINNQSLYIPQIRDQIFVNTTIGISICQDFPLKSAYTALNKARRESLDFCLFNSSIDEKKLIQTNNYWNKKIKYAIQYGRVVPFYQAIVDKNHKIIKYEVLMRIKDTKDDEVIFHSPYKFLNIAKRTNQYSSLSFCIISDVLKQLKDSIYPISINMNYSDTQDEKIKELLDKHIKTKELGKKLTIEILEDDEILDYKKLKDFISYYKSKGIKFAIDDFGAGYSNLSNVLNLNPDFLKIDGSLIKNIDKDKTSYQLVKSIIKLSEEMDIKIIAEFVHNEIVFKKLKVLNLYGYQGYYFHEPEQLQ